MAIKNVRVCDIFRFLPSLAQQALDTVLNDAAINTVAEPTGPTLKVCEVQGDVVRIGNTTAARYETSASSKVPDVLFFDVPQVRIIAVVCDNCVCLKVLYFLTNAVKMYQNI
jgi:hypothetical protein